MCCWLPLNRTSSEATKDTQKVFDAWVQISAVIWILNGETKQHCVHIPIFHGFNCEQDRNVDDVYIVKYLIDHNQEQNPEVILCPGRTKMQYVIGEEKIKIENYEYTQKGDIPGARSGHQCFVVQGQVLLVGGHLLVEQKLAPGKEMSMDDHPVYTFDPDTREWKTVNLRPNNSLIHLLNRSNFGAVQKDDEIWITGGVIYEDGQMRTLPINQLICMDTSQSDAINVKVIQLRGVEEQINIQNFALTLRPNSTELYLFGGDLENTNPLTSNQLEKNKDILKIDIEDQSLGKHSIKIILETNACI